jgi:hypothetical protein
MTRVLPIGYFEVVNGEGKTVILCADAVITITDITERMVEFKFANGSVTACNSGDCAVLAWSRSHQERDNHEHDYVYNGLPDVPEE